MNISFDYDFTLSEESIQEIAQSHIDDNHNVYITTTRLKWDIGDEHKNRDLYSVAKKLNINRDRIKFTNGEKKFSYLNDFDIHYDDDMTEIELIKENTSCRTFLISEDEDFNIEILEII